MAKNATGGLSEKQDTTFHEKRAEMLLGIGGPPAQASTGTSDTRLLKNPDGSVAYAYKSIEGESSDMWWRGQVPSGAGTAAEVLTSKLSEVLGQQCGFNSGFPKTTLAKLPVGGDAGKPAVGALIEGMRGAVFDRVESDKAGNEWSGTANKPGLTQDQKNAAIARARALESAGRKDQLGNDFAWDDADQKSSYVKLLCIEQMDTIRNVPSQRRATRHLDELGLGQRGLQMGQRHDRRHERTPLRRRRRHAVGAKPHAHGPGIDARRHQRPDRPAAVHAGYAHAHDSRAGCRTPMTRPRSTRWPPLRSTRNSSINSATSTSTKSAPT